MNEVVVAEPNDILDMEHSAYKIMMSIIDRYEIEVGDVISKRRNSPHTLMCRFEVYHTLHERGYSYPQIGKWLNRDHSTILYGKRKHQWRLDAERKKRTAATQNV